MIKLAERIQKMEESPIRKLAPFAESAKKRGLKVYHLNIGDPDVETPTQVLKGLSTWAGNPIGYTGSQGTSEVLNTLTAYYKNIGAQYVKPENIQVTSGASEAISMALFAVCEPKDEVLIFEPFYANYSGFAHVNGVKLVPVSTNIKDGFHLPAKKLIESKITSKTKAILICTPNNPTGTVYTKKEMAMLVELSVKHNLFLISDEAYREFCYDGVAHTSLLSYMEKYPEQMIVLDSLSKRYSMCGVRIGNLVSLNAQLMAGVLKIAQARLSCGALDQFLAAKTVEVPKSYFKKVNKEYQKRRDTVFGLLKKINGVTVSLPEGAFYFVAGLPVKNAGEFCKWLLTDFSFEGETLMLAPAAGFYSSSGMGLNEVRLAYVLNVASLKRCMVLLAKALELYRLKEK